MNDRIAQALNKLFDRHRIVFWYDTKRELRETFEALSLPGIEKLEINNNEYGLKYKVLRKQAKQKFLLYHEGPQPADLDNWLLDVQLAQGEFRADQIGIWLSELELGLEFTEVVQVHTEFFRLNKRREALKKLLATDDTIGQIRLKMLALCAGSEARMDAVLENLLQELANQDDKKIKLIHRCNLENFLWEQMARCYGYQSGEPSIQDFSIELFKSCYAMGTNGEAKLTNDALVFLKRWKDSRTFADSFKTLSEGCTEVLEIEQDLAERDFRDVIELDYFLLIDKKIIDDLVQAIVSRTATSADVSNWVRQRRQTHWYDTYQHLYGAIDYAARFIHILGETRLDMNSLTESVRRYSDTWYQVDQLYRKFVYHAGVSGQASLMGPLLDQIENLYSNTYLLQLGNSFQRFVDSAAKWEAPPVRSQKVFFERWVQPFLKKGHKICVIISDALRYEIGHELLGLIRQEDRYNAEMEPMLSMLPSYTQLGMAALLPHKELAFADKGDGTVLVDGQSSQGKDNRNKILAKATSEKARACKFNELMTMDKETCRALVRDHDLIYVYHNRIDLVGDKRESEGQVFEAVEESLQELVRLIKKLAGANVNNLLVSADHGFLYQNRVLDESDFLRDDAEGERIVFRDRRFVLGKGLAETAGLRTFTAAQLGLAGDMEVQIPKSINRLRLKGSGSRFVHGGASLQEVVLPVISIKKKRQSDVTAVEVDILRGASSMITSGQLVVTMYQAEPVTEKKQPRVLRAGIYTKTGELISDSQTLVFDLASDNPRERELPVHFVLSRKADEANGQEVILRLEEKHGTTSHYKEYKSLNYMMRRSFTSDFDF